MSPRLLAISFLLTAATTSLACGGRLLELGDPNARRDAGVDGSVPDDAGADAGYDAGFDAGYDAGQDSGKTLVPDEEGGSVDPCRDLPPPQCTPTATCGGMFVEEGEGSYGTVKGYFNFDTIYMSCPALPTIVQQEINGEWVQLLSLESTTNPGTPSPNTYIIGREYPLSSPQEGAQVGSVQSIRACTAAGQCLVCDPPQSVTVLDCGACSPINCGSGKFVDVSCKCVTDLCPCPIQTFPNCTIPAYQCF